MENLIDRARRAAGLSIQALADRAGTSRPTLSAYIHGRVHPQLDTLERIIEATGHDLDITGRPLFRQVPGRGGRVYHVPDRLWRLPTTEALARITLPLHVKWSSPARTYDMANRHDRRLAYEALLREGTPDDLTRFIDGVLLMDSWDELVIPRDLRAVWANAIQPGGRATNSALLE